MAEIVTLENLKEKLPQWSPHDDNHKHAIVDMGSNGIRFSITSLEPPTTRLLTPLYSTRAAISLFDALQETERGLIFPDATIQQVSKTLARYRHIAALNGVARSNITIIATEAMRRAANAVSMLTAISEATDGLQVLILEPAVETLLGAVMGSRSGLVDVKGGALFLDLGGGSVQMTYLDTDTPEYELQAALAGQSLPYGAARMTRLFHEASDTTVTQSVHDMSSALTDVYAKLCSTFPRLKQLRISHEQGHDAVVDLYLCGGGFRGYGSLLMHDDPTCPYPISSINTYSVDSTRFKDTAKMRRLNEQISGKISGLSHRRRRQFPAIAAVVDALVSAVPNIGRVTFCGGSNREGALMMILPPSLRECNPLTLLARDSRLAEDAVQSIAQLLEKCLPSDLDFSCIPTIVNQGLSPLLVRDAWVRQGYDKDTNISHVLHHAVCRDPNAPGLTHQARSLLAVALSSFWSANPTPADLPLYLGFEGVLQSHHPHAVFWAKFIGASTAILAILFPVLSADSILFSGTRLRSSFKPRRDKKSHVCLHVQLGPDVAHEMDLQTLTDQFENSMKKPASQNIFKATIQFETTVS